MVPATETRRMAIWYLLVLATCAVITAIGNVFAANWTAIFPAHEPVNLDQDIGDTVVETQGNSESADWVILKHNVVYRAETDGIVAASSGGDGDVAAGLVLEGASQSGLRLRTRFGKYDGAVLPVRRGRYWMVQAEGAGERNIEVQWLALPPTH